MWIMSQVRRQILGGNLALGYLLRSVLEKGNAKREEKPSGMDRVQACGSLR